MCTAEFLKTWYGQVLASERHLVLQLNTTACQHCGRDKKDHLIYDERCSTNNLSNKYLAVTQKQIVKLRNIATKLEELAKAAEISLI